MAIATQWIASNVQISSSAVIATTATSANSPYLRDLVVNNGGTAAVAVSFGGGSAATASSFQIPAGGTLILTQCQVPNSTQIWGVASSGTVPVNVGYATNVAYI